MDKTRMLLSVFFSSVLAYHCVRFRTHLKLITLKVHYTDSMATGQEKVDWNLVKVETLTLQTDEKPDYSYIVLCQDKIVVLNKHVSQVQLFRRNELDCQFLATTDREEPMPRAMCLMDAMTICVLYEDGLIEKVSIDSTDMSKVLKNTMELRLQGVMDHYSGVVRFKDGLVVVCGIKQEMMCWCLVSLPDGHVGTIHQICKLEEQRRVLGCKVTTKDEMVYIAIYEVFTHSGVYGFDNSSQYKCQYKDERLQEPRSIVVNEDGNIFVSNGGVNKDPCIYQLTASCELVAIFTQGIPNDPRALFWDKGLLYVTCYESPNITIFTHLPQGIHEDSEVGTSIETEQGNSEVGTSIEIEQGNLFQKSVEEKVNQAQIQVSTEELGSFLSFQREIGTTRYFSKGLETSDDGQEYLNATEMFLEKKHPEMMDKWKEYKDQGILTPELIDVIYSEERRPELHCKKDMILKQMEQLNIIVKARSHSENGVKEEDFFFTPCMLHQEPPREVISPKQDPRVVSTSVLCFVFTENVKQHGIFNELLAACIRRWPVAKMIETSENLIFCNCAIYDLNLFHRVILQYRNHVIFARVTRMASDKAETPDAKLWTRVRKFITLTLRNITSRLDPNLKYELCVQSHESEDVSEESMFHFSPPFHMWFLNEEHDPDSPITREHMNHARLNVALVTVCGKAMRDILLTKFESKYKDIYDAISKKERNLIPERGRALLDQHQIKLVYPKGTNTVTVDQFDLSLLYKLIRNVSTVKEPTTHWANDPQDTPRDNSLGASVERIRSYRNLISGHSPDAKMKEKDFEDYWNKFDAVLFDIENALGKQVYCSELAKHKNQVISVYEA